MVSLGSLWLPILASAGFVFVMSSVIHMVLGYHRSDYGTLPGEDDVQAALRKFNLPTGDFMLPCAQDPKQASSQAFREKLARGPVMMLTVIPNGGASMAQSLAVWFGFCLLVGLFVAYVASFTLAPGTHYRVVFRLVSTVAFGAHVLGLWPMSIWYSRSWGSTLRGSLDGLIYALITAGTFGWLWPR